jgi:hypothetical protein
MKAVDPDMFDSRSLRIVSRSRRHFVAGSHPSTTGEFDVECSVKSSHKVSSDSPLSTSTERGDPHRTLNGLADLAGVIKPILGIGALGIDVGNDGAVLCRQWVEPSLQHGRIAPDDKHLQSS